MCPLDPFSPQSNPDRRLLSVSAEPGGRCWYPGSTAAEAPPEVTLSWSLFATQLSLPPSTSHAAADGGGDICLRVTCLTVAMSPSSSLCPGWRSLEPLWQRLDRQPKRSPPHPPPTSAASPADICASSPDRIATKPSFQSPGAPGQLESILPEGEHPWPQGALPGGGCGVQAAAPPVRSLFSALIRTRRDQAKSH